MVDEHKSESKSGGRPVGFWSTQTLKNNLPHIILDGDYDPKLTKQSVHRLRMGCEYYITKDASSRESERKSISQIWRRGEAFCIPAGHFAFLLTKEKIKMPKYAIGFLSIKTEKKFLGLVNISGFHVDPGYEGKIVFSVFNAGPNDVHLRQGEEIFRLWIASLDDNDEEPCDPEKDTIYNKIPTSTVNSISGSLDSIQGIAQKIEKMKNIQTRHEWQLALIIGVIAVGFSGWIFEVLFVADLIAK